MFSYGVEHKSNNKRPKRQTLKHKTILNNFILVQWFTFSLIAHTEYIVVYIADRFSTILFKVA